MPGKEIKGRSKIANYRHGGRIGFEHGTPLKASKSKIKYRNGNKDKKGSSNGIGSGAKIKGKPWYKIR